MKYTIKVDTIPFDYWQSNTLYNVGDWIQFFTDSEAFPFRIESREESENTYIYKLA